MSVTVTLLEKASQQVILTCTLGTIGIKPACPQDLTFGDLWAG